MNVYNQAFRHIKEFSNEFWLVILASFINQAGNMALVFLVVYSTQFLGLSLLQGSTAFAMLGSSMLMSGLFAGDFIDRFGASKIMIGSILLNGVIVLVISTARHYHLLLIMCLLWGIFFGVFRPASHTLISQLANKGMYKITFSIYRLAVNLGMSLGPAIGGYLVAHSFPLIFVVNGIANILAGLILLFGLSRTQWQFHQNDAQAQKVFSLKWLQRDSALRVFLFGMIPVSMVFFQHESTLAVYLTQNLGFSLSFYGFLFTINTLMIVFLELLLNVATLNWPYRVNFIVGSALITLSFVGIYWVSATWQLVMLSMLWTLGEMILYPAASSYIAELATQENRGSYMSLFSTCSNLGFLIGPWVGALCMQYIGNRELWIACGIVGVVSLLLFIFVKEPKKNILSKNQTH